MPTYTAHITVEEENIQMTTEITLRGFATPVAALESAAVILGYRHKFDETVLTITITPIFNEEGL